MATVEYVQEVVCEVIFDCIEKKSYEIALEKTDNKVISLKVSSGIRGYANRRMDPARKLKPGALEKFVGIALKEMVEGDCQRFDNVQETVQMKIIKCKFCRKKFVEAEFIVMTPCGHRLCRTCAHDLFVKQENTTCPRCADLIDRKKIFEALSLEITF